MSKIVPFKSDEVCDGCGALGAYDFMGDYYCQKCTDESFERERVETEENFDR